MNIVIIVLIVFVLILLYFLFINYASGNALVSSPIFLKNGGVPIGKEHILNPANTTSSYSIWVYLNTKISSSSIGNIFQLNKSSGGYKDYAANGNANATYGVVGLYINGSNSLIFTDSSNVFTVMKNFPYQKWTNVSINIHQMLQYEIYINGKLVNTFKTNSDTNKPDDNSSIYLGGDTNKPDIIVTKLVRVPKTLDSLTIWNNYLAGNGMASNTFNAELSIKKEDEVIKNYSLFSTG